ncbi:MAG TPA: hypothetical protein VFF06_24180 [Polyangia bacterium]|nr:hypothetical protein [Polyangia bacterium]
MKKRTIVLFFALAALAPVAARADGGFQFKVPDGWVDLSPGAPAKNFERLSPEMARQLRDQHLQFYAADLEHAEAFLTNVSASVTPGASKIDDATLDELARSIDAAIKKQPGRVSYRMTSRQFLKLGDVTVARYVGELTVDGKTVKQLGWLMPGHEHSASLTYSTTEDQFARYEPIFDAAARATTGLVDPAYDLGYRLGYVIGRALVLMLLVFGALMLWRKLRARGK